MVGKEKGGFTLIELLVAMAVMAFGILGFSFLNSRALQNRTYSREMSRSNLLASTVAERFNVIPFDDDLLQDDNSDSSATEHPGDDFTAGDTGTLVNFNYTIANYTTAYDAKKWYRITENNQNFYLRWEVVAGNNAVIGTPDDYIKLVRIFTAFEKKDPATNSLSLKGYNPVKIGPTIVLFVMDKT